MDKFDYQAKLDVIPHAPGCYQMKDKRGKIVYIGKAKDLNNRVRSYFTASGDQRAFVARLPYILGDIDFIVTANEKEAMILENTLIKSHKPKFNVQLKDDKNFLSLRIQMSDQWPRVEVVRRQPKDDARYFGPYHSASAIRSTLNVLNKHFGLRTCPDSVLNNRSRPCLQYQIKRCPGPCVFDIDRDAYLESVQEAVMFLEGRGEELVAKLTERMMAASQAMEFELAAHYRDQIQSIEKVMERQLAVSTNRVDRDIFGFWREGDRLTIQVMYVRDGKLEGARAFSYTDQAFPDAEVFSSFLNLYYNSGNAPPREILLPFDLPETEVASFEELLSEAAARRVYIHVPQRGSKKALVDTATTNAKHSFEEEHAKEERARDLLDKLGNKLGLRNYPRRIECYDVSNLQGKQIVGSRVVFVDGEPVKKFYRHYKMRQVDTQDDFASMREMLMRRFRKIADDGQADEADRAPDLVVIDGGKGQLAQAVTVLEDLGLHDIDLIGLAKGRTDKVGFDDPVVSRSPERVFLPGRKNPIILKQNSAPMYLLQRVRDEAHDFAIGFHKRLRRKQTLRSGLEDIPGVGPQTRKDLLRHFGSLKKIKSASLDQLLEVDGVGEKTAQQIADFFAR